VKLVREMQQWSRAIPKLEPASTGLVDRLSRKETGMPGNKTHEEQIRTFERKDDVPKKGEYPTKLSNAEIAESTFCSSAPPPSRDEEGYATGHSGQQESRDHNKHNNAGQSGHAPQKHSRAEEKH
jgi:hypothetical protein